MSITGQNAILNQYTPTFYINKIVGGQTLVYDPIKQAFVNAYISDSSVTSSLENLSDVQLNVPGLLTGQVLTWHGPNNWTNSFVNYNLLTNAPALSPVATVGTLVSLTDVNSSGLVDNDTIVWDTTTSKWIVVPHVEGASSLTDLNDVSITSAVNNQIFYYDSVALKWKNINLSVLSKAVQSITALKDVNTTIVNNGYLRWNSLGTSVNYSATIPTTDITGLSTVATSGSYVDLTNKPFIPTATSQITNDSGFLTPATGVTHIIAGQNIAVSPLSGVGTVTISSTANIEKVVYQYTPGSTGNFIGVIPTTTAGVTVNIVDHTNCVVEYTFTGYANPPTSITTYGQNYSNNVFAVRTSSQLPINNNTIVGGGTVTTPDLINNLFGSTTPLTLQTRMSDTGASAGFGQRAYLMILFKF